MIRKVDVKSVFGSIPRISYEYMKIMKEKNKDKVLIVDDKDGLHSIPFAYYGFNVVMYEPEKKYIVGGVVDGMELTSINNRKNYKKVKHKIKINNYNFYELKVNEKFDFVLCYRSLHEKHNKYVPMKRKIRKLQSSVKEGGYIYIFYYMAKNEKDISNFSKNQYFRRGEMLEYFDTKNWEVIFLIENNITTNHNAHPYHKKTHKHIVGHIFAKKKNNRLIHRNYYDIIGVSEIKYNFN